MDQFFSISFIIGIGFGLLIIPTLLFRNNNTISNRILALLLFFIVADLVIAYLMLSVRIQSFIMYHFDTCVIFLYGPCLFLYTRELIASENNLHPRDLLHFVPFAVLFSFGLLYYLEPSAEQIEYLNRVSQGNFALYEIAIEYTVLLHCALYSLMTSFRLNRHTKNIHNFFSDIKRLRLIWLRFLIYGIFLLASLGFVAMLIFLRVPDGNMLLYKILYLCMTLLLYVTGIFALNQPGIFQDLRLMEKTMKDSESAKEENDNDEKLPRAKYEKNKLDEKVVEEYLGKIESIMEEEKLYKDPGINLQKFSSISEIPPHNISQVLNTRRNQNFFHFINSYRIEEAKKDLANSEKKHLSVLEIAYEVGFNSKSTFNAAFKKYTHVTPTEYRKRELDSNG